MTGKPLVPGYASEAELIRWMKDYGPMLTGTCTALLGDEHLAQDIVQETFIRAYQAWNRFRGAHDGSEKAWLTRIAVNLCRDQQRSKWFRLVDRRVPVEELTLPMPEASGEAKQLFAAVLSLPQKYREVILLHFYQDMSVGEIAKDVSAAVSDTQAAQAPSAPDAAPMRTVRNRILENLYARRFNLALNQTYFDGNKLYYAYTLTTNAPLTWYRGEGLPTGFDSWDMQEEGKYVEHYANADEDVQREIVTFFASHPVGYIGRESMGVGDGADLNGKPLTLLDSSETVIDDHTIQGFQEVEMPEGFTPEGEIEIELSILYGTSVYFQDESSVYWAHVATPENRGILHLPFTVTLNGQTEDYAGTVATRTYSAAATVKISDVDVSGEVVFDAPEWGRRLHPAPTAAIRSRCPL